MRHHADVDAHHALAESRRMAQKIALSSAYGRMQKPRRSPVKAILVVIAIAAGMFLAGIFEKQTLDAEKQQYCHLVWLHLQDPSIGWPDYARSFNADCNSDGTVKEAK